MGYSKKPKSHRSSKNGGSSSGNRSSSFKGRSKGRPEPEKKEIRLNKTAHKESMDISQDRLDHWKKETNILNEFNLENPNPKFELDPWQQTALEVLRQGENLVVDAPTTAGKTRAIEAFFDESIDLPNFRAAYTTPVKSLSNDKVREFRERYGKDRVGIATGDVKENLHAPIVVTTLETYRNSLLGVEPDLQRSLVVFDEYHFMQDNSRGSAWEESIILTPPSCQMALLSASVKNGEEFVQWLENVHTKSTRLVRTETRPVPLESWVYLDGEWRYEKSITNQKLLKYSGRQFMAPKPQEIAEKVAKLIPLGIFPAILYSGRRKTTEYNAAALTQVLSPISDEDKKIIQDILDLEQQESRALDFIPRQLKHAMVEYGVAYHHSGMAPPVRLAIERCLKAGALRFCCATMGLSIGINFSVKATVITDFTRPGENGFTRYDSSEALQMLGRAGRRGRDPVGFSLWLGTDFLTALRPRGRENCESRLKNDPTTMLGLISRGMDEKQIELFYGKSFKRFNDKGVDLGIIRKSRIEKKLDSKELPCTNPAYEYGQHLTTEAKSTCSTCPYKVECHKYIGNKLQSDIAALHMHLYVIGAIGDDRKLTDFGHIAKHLPQSGGMLISRYIQEGIFTEDNLLALCQVLASFSLGYYKSPNVSDDYRVPEISPKRIRRDLEFFYTPELFLELYEEDTRWRSGLIYKEYNEIAGYAVKLWLSGASWKELEHRICNEKFGQGDLMSLMYRVGSFLQSISQIDDLPLGKFCKDMREELLRDPITPKL